MTSLPTTARLYARVAFLRHRILLQHAANRAAVTAFAVLLLLAGFGLLNGALFLYLRTMLSNISAVLVVAAVHLGLGGILLFVTWQSHDSPELQALAATEAEALTALDEEASGTIESFEAIGHRLASIGTNVRTVMTAINGLQSLLAAKAYRNADNEDAKSKLTDPVQQICEKQNEPASHS